MKQMVIIASLKGEGFSNWGSWTLDECKRYVKNNYSCSDYIAKKVASEIVNW